MNDIRKNALILLGGTGIVLILEALPFGAVLNFANGDGETIRKTFSYFSLIPYGYANVCPFFTAILTCALFILCITTLIFPTKFWLKQTTGAALLSLTTSLLPLFNGISYYSVTALFISLILITVFILAIIFQLPHIKPKTEDKKIEL